MHFNHELRYKELNYQGLDLLSRLKRMRATVWDLPTILSILFIKVNTVEIEYYSMIILTMNVSCEVLTKCCIL